jgi:hypothetical protein
VGGYDGEPGAVAISVPARAGLVGTIRVFASAVARHLELEDGLVEDVKLAVSEACTDPVQAGVGGDISVTILAQGSGLVCEVASRSWPSTDGAVRIDLPEGVDPVVLDRLQLVRALFPDAERVERDDETTLRFSTSSRGF